MPSDGGSGAGNGNGNSSGGDTGGNSGGSSSSGGNGGGNSSGGMGRSGGHGVSSEGQGLGGIGSGGRTSVNGVASGGFNNVGGPNGIGGNGESYRSGPNRTGPDGTLQTWTAVDGWHDVKSMSRDDLVAKGYTPYKAGTFLSPDRLSIVNSYGQVVGIGNGHGFMTAIGGYQRDTMDYANPYGIDDRRSSYYGGWRDAKSAIGTRALSDWNNVDRVGLMDRMKGLPQPQRDAYLTAFDHARFDQIPAEYMSTSATQAAQEHLDALNGPIASALNLTQTPYEAINDLARDLTFNEKGEMGLKASSVYSNILGADLYSAPLGATAMIAGDMINGLPGKIVSALGQNVLAPGPLSALGWMKNTIDLAQKAHVAGVKAPERNTFNGVETGGALRLPGNVQTVATRSPASSNSSSSTNLSRSYLNNFYGGFGYTLI